MACSWWWHPRRRSGTRGLARARQFLQHRAWAIRLVALAVGAWLYRMDDGRWLKRAHGIGHHSRTFDGPFDAFMAFFYVPNLAVAEALIRAPDAPPSLPMRRVLMPLVIAAAALIALATWRFTASFVLGAAYHGPPRGTVGHVKRGT
jgi:hypothetical protein